MALTTRLFLTLRFWDSATADNWGGTGEVGRESVPSAAYGLSNSAVQKVYVRNGRSYWEETIEDCGHSPHEGKLEECR